MSYLRPELKIIKERTKADILARLPYSNNELRNILLDMLVNMQANTAHGIYGALEFYSKQIFPDSAEAEYLDRQLRWRGIYRIPATGSAGQVEINGNHGVSVAVGERLRSSDGIDFEVVKGSVVSKNKAILELKSLDEGLNSNIKTGTIVNFSRAITGVNSQAVAVNDFAGGTDIESDTTYRSRGLQVMQGEQFLYGKQGDWIIWAVSATNEITKAFEVNNVGNTGKLVVYVLNNNQNVSSAGIANAVQYIKDRAPLGVVWSVENPIITAVDIELSITPNQANKRNLVEQALQFWFDNSIFLGFELTEQILINVVLSVAGVTNVTFNAPLMPIKASFNEYLKLNSVSFS